MHFLTYLVLELTASSYVLAAINGACSVSGTPGVCLSTGDCAKGGGKSTKDFCPNDPADVQCCTKSSCGSGGNCRFASACTGTTQTGLCPGPDSFKCCLAGPAGGSGSGSGAGNPSIPTNNCKPHVVSAGETIVKQFSGEINTVYCYADKPGEHGKGLALDLMVKSFSPIGQTIAEWVMNQQSSLRVMYIIWGQKIWNPSTGEKPTGWANWRGMEDRGSVTQNHWDHVHVSFLE